MSLSGEVLFYGGIVVAAAALVLAIVFFCVFKIKSARLNAKLNQEYGEKRKRG